ncbi:carboxypeptidase-like regulatory domain-containing protein [Myxococcus sp. K15C18031901]|uniref:carboxypeptidase regulatory-like domain-containing protein n=1 Tax=Myxococcus dinghuensis TaxID=2906761 RepID=UPI0020A72350|nr:carboxypeptidase regulatory-like domain-containing protein [Myxococcus dinghuensis]MCP3099311.1 carboxypeptidase-like regulatory domain-containing protein [Myxococcus dinghuensis]
MRKAIGVCVFVGALALLGVWFLRDTASPPAPAAPAPAPGERATRTTPPVRETAPGGGLSIQGTVVDVRGRPVAGVRVSASWPDADETLSELPCPPDLLPPWERPASAPKPGFTLLTCLPRTQDTVLEMLAARQGEAVVHAEATSTEDGTFLLEGLPEGPQMLWALGQHVAGARPGIPAGSRGVEVVLEEVPVARGVVRGEGSPLADARVTYVTTEHTRFFDTRTDAQGRFQLGPLPPERYYAFVSSEGWLPRLVSVSRGGPELEVALRRPHRLSGQVLSQGAPVAGVEVVARRDEDAPVGTEFPALRRTSDARGRFAFELEPGPYRLSAERDGAYALTHVALGDAPADDVVVELGGGLFVEGTVFDARRVPIAGARVQARDEARDSLQLEARTTADGHYRMGPVEEGSLWGFSVEAPGFLDQLLTQERKLARGMGPQDFTLQRAVSVVGRVVDTRGQPLEGIHLRMDMDDFEDMAGHEAPEDAYSKADGSFVLDAARPGRYTLVVDDDRFIHVSQEVVAPTERLVVRLDMGATVVASVVDDGGLPLSGFRVELWPLSKKEDEVQHLGVSDPRGRATRQGLPPGRYMAVASRSSDGVEREATHEVTVDRSASVDVELRMAPELRVSGTVLDQAGRPVTDAAVQATRVRAPNEPWGVRIVRPHHARGPAPGVRTDAEGRFTLRGLTRAEHQLDVVKEGYWFQPARSQGIQVVQERARLQPTGDPAPLLVMERRSHARGRVVRPDGAPSREFDINRQTQRSEDGAFVFPITAVGTSMPLVFEDDGLPPVARMVEADPTGADVDLGVIRLGAGRALTGQVLDGRTGAPVALAVVSALAPGIDFPDERPLVLSATMTDARGAFTLTDVDEGTFPLLVEQPDRYLPARVTVEPGATQTRVLLERGATLQVTALDRAKRPVTGTVRVTPLDAKRGQLRYTDIEEGRGEVRGLAAGTYRVGFIPKSRADDREALTFLDQTLRLTTSDVLPVAFLEAESGVTVKLRSPAAGTVVVLVPGDVAAPRDAEALRRTVDLSLNAESSPLAEEVVFENVPPGHYTVFGWKVVFFDDRFLREELDVPATGTVLRAIAPTWRTFDVASR